MTQPLPSFLFWLCCASGLLLVAVAMPLWLRRIPPNRLYGARFSATLADSHVWYEINARAGRELVVIGAAYAVLVAVIATTPGWNNAAALLAATGAWVAALVTVSVRLGKAARRLHDERRRWLERAKLICAELFRVLSNEPAEASSGALAPVLVAFAGRSDVLPFLRTVPSGTSRAELEQLAVAYCAAHPPPCEDDVDGTDAGAPEEPER